MEIELSHVFEASAEDLWSILLNPEKVSKCVPGMQSVEVVSETEYNARIKVKIAFISAHFTLRTVIAEMRPSTYLRAEVTGQDNSIGSSVKAVAEMNLAGLDRGRTELRVVTKASVLGRLGALGLNPMKTKAERMWDQFCVTLEGVLAGHDDVADTAGQDAAAPTTAKQIVTPLVHSAEPSRAYTPAPAQMQVPRKRGFFSWFGKEAGNIHVEIDGDGARIAMTFPPSHADQCLAWIDRHFTRQNRD